MSNNKMKGLLKGLRYISQIFDNEKEPEMQIGFPTDVKHVAHIGWDGPSVNCPSWMSEFKAPESNGESKANGEAKANGDAKDDAAKWVSEDAIGQRVSRGSQTSRDRDLLELPRSSRRHSSSTAGAGDSNLSKEKSEKKHSEKSEKKSRKSSRSGTKELSVDGGKSSSSRQKDAKDGDSSSSNPSSDLPKKVRRKKSKDSSGKSSRSKEKSSDADSESGSVSKSLCIDCDTSSVLSALEEDDAERLTEVS